MESDKKCRYCSKFAVFGKTLCQKHLDAAKISANKLNKKRKEKRLNSICYDCDSPALDGKTRCSNHLEKNAKGVTRFLKSEKGFYYLETDQERTRIRGNKSRAKSRRENSRFSAAKGVAKSRGKFWNLSKEEYMDLIKENCFYCELPNNVETGVGLDRMDNSKGYEPGNVVSCCKECNPTKGARFTSEEMKFIGKAIKCVKLNRIGEVKHYLMLEFKDGTRWRIKPERVLKLEEHEEVLWKEFQNYEPGDPDSENPEEPKDPEDYDKGF